ncbi:hypothetical protein [Methylobacterium radiodurans]|uniref:Uncharacterized protein n=1 Tax=Methylobacterium radiodurans TaxID=2202828 RepID=A0A2U8VUF7_9HYPH|nr:hypothetical protein [Methylobacterium radiodurans]AWN37429.1 hypothetical protein DK427_18275 [Methylobacterium radiodurans]
MIPRPRLLAAAALLAALALAFGRTPPKPQDPCSERPRAYPCALFGPAPIATAPLRPETDTVPADGTS